MTEAARCLSLSEAGSRKKLKSGNGGRAGVGARVVSRFPPGLEWEILVADAVVMLGLTHALRYLSCNSTGIPLANAVTVSRTQAISNACDYNIHRSFPFQSYARHSQVLSKQVFISPYQYALFVLSNFFSYVVLTQNSPSISFFLSSSPFTYSRVQTLQDCLSSWPRQIQNPCQFTLSITWPHPQILFPKPSLRVLIFHLFQHL